MSRNGGFQPLPSRPLLSHASEPLGPQELAPPWVGLHAPVALRIGRGGEDGLQAARFGMSAGVLAAMAPTAKAEDAHQGPGMSRHFRFFPEGRCYFFPFGSASASSLAWSIRTGGALASAIVGHGSTRHIYSASVYSV